MTAVMEIEAVQRSLGRLEGKMDILLQNMNQHLLEDTARFDKMNARQDIADARQTKIEKGMAVLIAKISVISTAIILVAKEAIAYILK